jgi:hypothetical protein
VKGGFFLRKKPLEYVVSVYTISENAVAVSLQTENPAAAWRPGFRLIPDL